MQHLANWLRDGLKKDGVTVEAVAKKLGKTQSTIYKLLDGTRKFKVDEVPIIAKAINEPIPVTDNSLVVPVSGSVPVNGWAKIKPVRPSFIAVVRDGRSPKNYTAYRVDGDCENDAAVRHGDDIACVDSVGQLETGMLVIAERQQGRLKEYVLRRIIMHGTRIGLCSISRIDKGGTVDYAGEGTKVCAVAVAVMRSLI
jgi:transcriptional regulator with XRE-family HTH domain